MPATNNHPVNRVFGDDVPLTVKEAAVELGLSVATMNRLIYSRQVASAKIGGRRKVRPSALKKYADGQVMTAV